MPKSDRHAEHRDEADRLALLPREEQEAVIAWLKAIAADSKVKQADRDAAGERAAALERLLKKRKKL